MTFWNICLVWDISCTFFILGSNCLLRWKIGFYISCKLFPMETICIKYQTLFSGKNQKNYHESVICWIALASAKGSLSGHLIINSIDEKSIPALWLSPRFLEKASGILLSPPSVCPSVCYVISSQTAGQNPTKFAEWLAYTSGACKSTFIFGPAPRGPGEGSKGQILTISNFKVNFKDFYAKMCTYTQ